MAKASMTLPDGTTVQIEGSADEIQKIISLHRPHPEHAALEKKEKKTMQKSTDTARKIDADKLDLSALVNALKSSDDVELIEKNILDRISMVDRILVPLYIVHKQFADKLPMSTGEISKFLSQLGITIHQANVANTLSSTASKYVLGDKVRVKGHAVRYRLSRRGQQYISTVIQGKADE